MAVHELPLERRTLHGHFSRDLEPVLAVDPGDSVVLSCLDSGWNVEPGVKFEPRDPELDSGHALVGPIEVRGAKVGGVLEVAIEDVRTGRFGLTAGGGWPNELNERLGLADGEGTRLHWELDPDAGVGRDQHGRRVRLAPFLGVIGMPPPEPGVHPTAPPRVWGGNLDCAALVAGTTLFLPIPVDGALVSVGDGHARRGDGEVAQLALECPIERGRLTLGLRDDLSLETPVAWTPGAWVVMGLDEDLDEAVARAVEGMLALMGRELGLDRTDALALASVVVDLRVTQVVNGVKGVHAVLAHDAIQLRR